MNDYIFCEIDRDNTHTKSDMDVNDDENCEDGYCSYFCENKRYDECHLTYNDDERRKWACGSDWDGDTSKEYNPNNKC
jgi:hypothetical protein